MIKKAFKINQKYRLNLSDPHYLVTLVVVSIIYIIAARLSLLLAPGNSNATVVWPPSGIALAVILTRGYRMWPTVFFGALAANILVLQDLGHALHYSAITSAAISAGNMLEGITGAYLIKRFTGTDNPFENIKDIFLFIILGCFAGTLISATAGVSSFCLLTENWESFKHLWITWWLGDVVGIITVSPAIIMLEKKLHKKFNRELFPPEIVFVFLFLAISAFLIFRESYRLEYLVILPLLWIAYRFGRFNAALAVIVVSAIAIACTIQGADSLTGQALNKSLLYLQAYIGVCAIITLCVSVLTYESIRDITERRNAELNLKQYRDNLEEIVKERSAALVKANEQLTREIEERDRAEKALIKSEREYRDLVESANSAILRWKPDGSVTFFNTFAQKFFGFTETEIIGRNVVGTIVPAVETSGRDLSLLMDNLEQHPEEHIFNENENIKKNGERVWIAWTNKPVIDESGSIAEILSVGNDITARKRMEESLRITLNELAIAKEQAEAADRLKSAFLASMSHELRTPLNSIIGFTGIILQGLAGPVNAEQLYQLGMVQGSAQHLLSLINDVLDISKIEAGQLDIVKEKFDMRSSIESVLRTTMPLANKKMLSLAAAIDSNVGVIESDRRRVEQILINLVSNAIKFTGKGEIRIYCRLESGWIETKVSDTGIGIRPQDIDKLFIPFRQLDTGISRVHEGTGLGLSICKKLVEMLGGDIGVESQWGKGSTFTFKIPVNSKLQKN